LQLALLLQEDRSPFQGVIEFGDFGSASGPTGERCSEIVPGIVFFPVTSVVSLNPLNLLVCRFHLDAGVLTELLPHLGHH